MPRTQAQLQKALTDTEAWLDTLDVGALASPDSDGEDLRAIGDALRAVATSDLALAQQVKVAWANGRTWTQIAAVLGVSKRAARERFNELALNQSVPVAKGQRDDSPTDDPHSALGPALDWQSERRE